MPLAIEKEEEKEVKIAPMAMFFPGWGKSCLDCLYKGDILGGLACKYRSPIISENGTCNGFQKVK